MKVEIVKRADGGGVLRCTRADGSVTWQKQEKHGAHFALHDLTHFAVETTLGYRRGFFGLIAEGWDIEDTTGKGERGPLPDETTKAESIVALFNIGLFDMKRLAGARWTAEEMNSVSHAVRRLADEEILAVRKRRGELFRRWSAVPVGGTLELLYQK
jgi:hypothetical protein